MLYGFGGSDTINGGASNDTIEGAAGKDFLTGGVGSDLFWFGLGESGTTIGSQDLILDWGSTVRINFSGAGTSYTEASVGDVASAVAFANAQIAAGIDVVAVQVGTDVMVFADTDGLDGNYEDAVILVGRTIADISDANIQ